MNISYFIIIFFLNVIYFQYSVCYVNHTNASEQTDQALSLSDDVKRHTDAKISELKEDIDKKLDTIIRMQNDNKQPTDKLYNKTDSSTNVKNITETLEKINKKLIEVDEKTQANIHSQCLALNNRIKEMDKLIQEIAANTKQLIDQNNILLKSVDNLQQRLASVENGLSLSNVTVQKQEHPVENITKESTSYKNAMMAICNFTTSSSRNLSYADGGEEVLLEDELDRLVVNQTGCRRQAIKKGGAGAISLDVVLGSGQQVTWRVAVRATTVTFSATSFHSGDRYRISVGGESGRVEMSRWPIDDSDALCTSRSLFATLTPDRYVPFYLTVHTRGAISFGTECEARPLCARGMHVADEHRVRVDVFTLAPGAKLLVCPLETQELQHL